MGTPEWSGKEKDSHDDRTGSGLIRRQAFEEAL
ncbi:hypothetical protein FHR97_001854 [Halomonas stenophila]|uniref:Uncharacterized protein n=1 Tax=Halomonas stenophila TaxID=795312 RepID=A0A7W5ET33_9GAMM|nr:hypothetical protein [Halomonas stenophila]